MTQDGEGGQDRPVGTRELGACAMVLGAAFAASHTLPRGGAPPVPAFLACYLVAGLAWGWAAVRVYRSPPRGPGALAGILGVAAALRLLMVFGPYTFSETLPADLHRFLYDGVVLAEGGDPYEFSPHQVRQGRAHPGWSALSPAAQARLVRRRRRVQAPDLRVTFQGIGNPRMPSTYPPLAELFFAACARVAPASEVALRAAIAVLDLLLCAVILAMLQAAELPAAWVLFYAWCPLPLREFAGAGHFDPLAMLPAAAGVWALMGEAPGPRRRVLAGACLGLGLAAKLYPLVLVVALAPLLGVAGVGAAALVSCLAFGPLVALGTGPWSGLGEHLSGIVIHSPVHWLVAEVLGYQDVVARVEVPGRVLELRGFHVAKLLLGGAYGAYLLRLATGGLSPAARSYRATLGLFVAGSTGFPWYLAWCLPFACLEPHPALLVLCVSISSIWLYWVDQVYRWWFRAVAYGPPLLAWWAWRARRR